MVDAVRPGARLAAARVAMARVLVAGGVCALLAACAAGNPAREAVRHDGPGLAHRAASAPDEPVRNLPKARYGNPADYAVFGRRYHVLDSAEHYRAQGTASWYGRQFHGRLTSSREPYDMHRFTAAHPSLPLPTFVRVTRTDTGQSVVVKVNDRGPFVDDRIIDLSYAAALALDMVRQGTAPVQIEALSTHLDATSARVQVPEPVTAPTAGDAVPQAGAQVDVQAGTRAGTLAGAQGYAQGHYVQLGAFASRPNATRLAERLRQGTALPARIDHDASGSLYRVQIGPLASVGDVRQALTLLNEAGFAGNSLMVREIR